MGKSLWLSLVLLVGCGVAEPSVEQLQAERAHHEAAFAQKLGHLVQRRDSGFIDAAEYADEEAVLISEYGQILGNLKAEIIVARIDGRDGSDK